jgi:hypothetical protein
MIWPNCCASTRVLMRDCRVTGFWPNKSLQPTATAVMTPAAQEIMPAVAVAEH